MCFFARNQIRTKSFPISNRNDILWNPFCFYWKKNLRLKKDFCCFIFHLRQRSIEKLIFSVRGFYSGKESWLICEGEKSFNATACFEFRVEGWVASSVTRLGDFWKFLATNSLTKLAQKDCWLLGLLIKVKLLWILFRQLLETIGQLFKSSSWSHWRLRFVPSEPKFVINASWKIWRQRSRKKH